MLDIHCTITYSLIGGGGGDDEGASGGKTKKGGTAVKVCRKCWSHSRGGGGHLGIFWVGMCHLGLQIGTPF